MTTVENWQDEAWDQLPDDIKQVSVSYLRRNLTPELLAEVKTQVTEFGLGEWLQPGWHFGQGMGVRNLLRDVVADSELPAFTAVGYENPQGNWDDYYVQMLEAAAGCRDL